MQTEAITNAPRSTRPRTQADVVEALAADRNASVVVRGGATMLACGDAPLRVDTFIDTRALDAVTEYTPEDMTVTVEAGCTLAALNRELAEKGQRVVLDSDDPERATIGGLLACDRPGPLALGFGSARDRVLGLRVVDGRGRALRFGGRVVKNVSGYDAAKLFVGSYGTLGVVTEATLRTHPLPQSSDTLCFSELDVKAAQSLCSQMLGGAAFPVALDFSLQDGAARVTALLEGTDEETDDQCKRLCALAGCEAEADDPVPYDDGASLVIRLHCASPGAVAQLSEAASDRRVAVQTAYGHAASGVCYLHAEVADTLDGADFVLELRRRFTYAVLERAPEALRDAVGTWGQVPDDFRLFQRIKKVFDPHGRMAPGRFVGGI